MRGLGIFLLCVGAPALLAHSPPEVAKTTESPTCSCERARRTNGWCTACGKGYVARIVVKSAGLFDTLDAHGHRIRAVAIACGSCQEALQCDGFCSRCRMGFMRGEAYLSRLAHCLAIGKLEDPDKLSCEVCRSHGSGGGWCEVCGVGRVGWLVLESREGYEHARREVALLRRALKKIPDCEPCGIARFTGGICRRHSNAQLRTAGQSKLDQDAGEE